MQGKVREGGRGGPVPQVLWNMLSNMQVRSFWDLWEQAPVPLLQGHEKLQGQAQMPLNIYLFTYQP